MTRLFIPILAICAAVFAALGAGANADHDLPHGGCPRGGGFTHQAMPLGTRTDRNADGFVCSNGNANIDNRFAPSLP